MIASGSDDASIKIWSTDTGSDRCGTTVRIGARCLTGERFVRRLFTLRGAGECLHNLSNAHTDAVYAVAYSPDPDRLLASGSKDGSVKLWNVDARNASLNATLIGHTAAVSAVDFSLDGVQVASASADGTAIIWELASGKPIRTFTGHTAAVTAVRCAPPAIAAVSDCALGRSGGRVVGGRAGAVLRSCRARSGLWLPVLALDQQPLAISASIAVSGLAQIRPRLRQLGRSCHSRLRRPTRRLRYGTRPTAGCCKPSPATPRQWTLSSFPMTERS